MARVYNISQQRNNFFGNLSFTFWIVGINFLVFLIALISVYINQDNIKYFALQPNYILQGKYLWTFITSMFTHLGSWHLFVNMVSLLFIGSLVEKILGKKRYLWFYLISGLVAGLFFFLLSVLF